MLDQTGHRQRIKNRFRQEGLDSFEDKHALELLLCYGLPRKDTKALAQTLINEFGGLTQVLDASAEQLEKISGVGENVSTFLTLVREFVRRYNISKQNSGVPLESLEHCAEIVKPYFEGKRNEVIYLLCLDAKFKILCCKQVGEGSVNAAAVSVRKIVETALNVNATTVVLAHNHPGGLAVPSEEDRQTTYRVANALRTVDVILADHIVVADDDAVSMVQSRFFDPNNIDGIY